MQRFSSRFKTPSRAAAGLVHLILSAIVTGFVALLVFALWYPYPYSQLSGGRSLLGLLVAVDVVLGPLITVLVFDVRKPRRELVMDLSVVVMLQMGALLYGIWSVYTARPVQLVYEYGRFGVAHAAEIDPVLVEKMMPGITLAPLSGPGLVSLRPFLDSEEQVSATMAEIGGAPLAARVDLWQPYELAQLSVLTKGSSVAEVKRRFPDKASLIEEGVGKSGFPEGDLRCVPLVVRGMYWTVLVHVGTAQPVAFFPLDMS